jgi:hypothetical protein
MPRTRTAAAQSSQGRKKAARAPLPQGWRTTDDDEIERRRQRAASEPLTVEALEPGHPVFGTFRVSSESGSYEVEIRSLLVTADTIEHRMLPLLANKQRLADGVLDGARRNAGG